MKILSCVMLALCCFVTAPAQERVMEKDEFEAVVTAGRNHHSKWKGEKYRMTIMVSSKRAGRPQADWSSKMVTEFGSPMEVRSISSSASGDKVNPTREMLRVGKSTYTRLDNGPWTRKESMTSNPPPPAPPENPFQILDTTSQYKYLGPGFLVDKPPQIYVKTERQTKVDNRTGYTLETDIKITYWIDASGTLLKSESISDHRGAKITSQFVSVMQWELDPSISFAAPEIVP